VFGYDTEIAEIDIGGRKIAYAIRQSDDSICLLFLHGLGCTKASFAEAFSDTAFAGHVTLLAPDLPGHGHSGRPKQFSYDLLELSDLLGEFLVRLGMRRVAIAAHSMANICGLALCEKTFELAGYFCLEGNLIPEDCNLSSRIAGVEEAVFVERLYSALVPQIRCKGLESEPVADPIAVYRYSRSLVDQCAAGRYVERFVHLPGKKAYFYGERNQDLTVLQQLGGTDIIEVPMAGHFLMQDNPQFTYGEIARRLDLASK
jgi:hypothetical protein